MILEKVIKTIRPEKNIQVDTFEWYEKGRFIAEEIKTKKNKKQIYVDSGFDEERRKYFIEYYDKQKNTSI